MAAGRGRGGASRAGSNHPSLFKESSCTNVAMFRACRWLHREALVIHFWFGPLGFHTAPKSSMLELWQVPPVGFSNGGETFRSAQTVRFRDQNGDKQSCQHV